MHAPGTRAGFSGFLLEQQQESQMTDTDRTSPDDRETQIEHLEDDAEAMDRPDRAIPLPEDDGDDEGVGEITGLVP